jgi:hypothetical protein
MWETVGERTRWEESARNRGVLITVAAREQTREGADIAAAQICREAGISAALVLQRQAVISLGVAA